MSATRTALVRLVWESLPKERRASEGTRRFVVTRVAVGVRQDELLGLTEAELLALLPEELKDRVTGRLNGEEPKMPLRKASSAPPQPAERRPGPRKTAAKRTPKKRETG